MRKPSPQTHQACRSLLQKAVRRGDVLLTRKIVSHLSEVGDANWLKMRTAVITFEECWPLGNNLQQTNNLIGIKDTLAYVSKAVKIKDAAGLGVLAYAHSEGDISMLSGTFEDKHIQSVSDAIRNPQKFWTWVAQNYLQDEQQLLLEASLKAYRRGGWPWDRALIQAAAYLAITDGIPIIQLTDTAPEEVPFWVGLDKHTPQGKKALQKAAQRTGLPSRQLSWISFYLESARVNASVESYWWSRECQWRLNQIGLNYDKALTIWDKVRPTLIRILKEETEALEMHLNTSRENPINTSEDIPVQQYRLPGF